MKNQLHFYLPFSSLEKTAAFDTAEELNQLSLFPCNLNFTAQFFQK